MNRRLEELRCEICQMRANSFFCDLSDSEIADVSSSKTSNVYQRKQVIFHEGNKPLGVYCIHSGKIKVHKLGNSGKDQIVRLAKQGEILGYRSLVSGEYYSASATALEDSTICFIPKQVFFDILQENVRMSTKMVELLSSDLKTAERRITHLAQKPVRERLAETILILMEYYGMDDDGITLTVSMTREEIANLVGTATESIIRLLAELRKEKVIDINGRSIKILNKPALIKGANIFD